MCSLILLLLLDPPPSCDIGWEAFNRSCYKFESVPRSWSEAKKACADTGGHLVKIDSADEEMFLTFKVRPFLHVSFST